MSVYYHYTTANGAAGINQSKRISASNPNDADAVYGAGVYLTDMPPSRHVESIGRNNWGTPTWALNNGRMDWVVSIRGLRGLIKCRDGVYLHRGDLNLEDYSYSIKENKA